MKSSRRARPPRRRLRHCLNYFCAGDAPAAGSVDDVYVTLGPRTYVSNMSYRILAVDDDPQTTGALKRLLEQHGYSVREENDARKALATARAFQPHVVILDFLMPEAHGGDVAWQFWCDPQLRNIKVVLCSGAMREEMANRLPPCPIPILEKPVDGASLLALLRQWTPTGEAQRAGSNQ
jgi:CheY-like chemotaxis protein